MSSYIRKCSLELLAYYYSNSDLEDEFQSLLKLVQDPELIQVINNLTKDEVLAKTLNLIDERVRSRISYKEGSNSPESIFEGVITEELATAFLYRLVELS